MILTDEGPRSAGCPQSTFKLLNFQFTNGSKNGELTEFAKGKGFPVQFDPNFRYLIVE